MSEAKHAVRIVRNAPRSDAAVFLTCFGRTVLLDMQIAVAAGIALVSILLIQRISEMTNAEILQPESHQHEITHDPAVIIYDVNGPLFFGVAHRALKVILAVDQHIHTVVLDMTDVALIDTTAMMNIEPISTSLAKRNISLHLINVSEKIAGKMRRYGLINGDKGRHLHPDTLSILVHT